MTLKLKLHVLHLSILMSIPNTFQGEKVQQGWRGAGVVLLTGDSLVLQKISRDAGGLYSCSAENSRGNETSNVIQLHVLCKCNYITFVFNH